MSYSVKEIFKTLQGEGFHTGRTAVFCRFSGCNLWNGLEKNRENAKCKFCDTDFIGTNGKNGAKFKTSLLLAQKIEEEWGSGIEDRYVVLTGGEPLLQVDDDLIRELHSFKFKIAIETNGTIIPPEGIDWICVSPKNLNELNLMYGNELKLVYPQLDIHPNDFSNMNFEHFFLQPLHNNLLDINTRLAVEYCIKNPKWRLSLQTHKYIGIP